MINIKNLTKKDIGRWVYYKDFDGSREYGKIKSWNDKYIFVVYEKISRDMNLFWNYTSVATKPEDLYWT